MINSDDPTARSMPAVDRVAANRAAIAARQARAELKRRLRSGELSPLRVLEQSRVPGSPAATLRITDFLLSFPAIGVVKAERVREQLEIEAAQHAAVHRSEEQLAGLREAVRRAQEAAPGTAVDSCDHSTNPGAFHLLVVEASGSKLLLDLYLGVMSLLQRAAAEGRVILGTTLDTMHLDHGAVLEAIAERDVRSAAHSMALHVDRDLGLRTDMLDFTAQTERAASLIGAGYDPGASPEDAEGQPVELTLRPGGE